MRHGPGVLTYLNGNHYMSGWGGTITATYTFLIISSFYETLYGHIVLCCNDDKYSGVSTAPDFSSGETAACTT